MSTSSQPTNTSEWQLYRVLQRANLLQYYDTFVAQGGDDVPQLCEAGEEEFLEIMALVGMASKPLHVRRLQKALQEYVANPAAFQGSSGHIKEPPTQVSSLPITSSTEVQDSPSWSTHSGSTPVKSVSPVSMLLNSSTPSPALLQFLRNGQASRSPSWSTHSSSTPVKSVSPVSMLLNSSTPSSALLQGKPWSFIEKGQDYSPLSTHSGSTPVKSVSPVSMLLNSSTPSPALLQPQGSQTKKRPVSPQPPPVLLENQINEIARCATKLAKTLPAFEVKSLNMKKDVNKQIYELMNISSDHPDRLELMRKYGAIYRRFDSQRVYEKSMSLHEVCVNEAAAQLCYHMPTLLTRREDLFPLARQVVKDSGYQYSKGHSRSSDVFSNPSKKPKAEFLQEVNSMDRGQREERLNQISKELSQISECQEKIVGDLEIAKEGSDMERIESLQISLEQITNKHLLLLTEQSDLLRKQSSDIYDENDASLDRDSNYGGSGSSSPSQNEKFDTSAPHSILRALFSGVQGQKGAKGEPGMKNTLFDEGLRIAQQYGLGDFAAELKTLKDTDTEEPSDSVSSLFPSSIQASSNGKSHKSEVNGTSNNGAGENDEIQGTIIKNGDGNQLIQKRIKLEPGFQLDEEAANGSS